MSVDEIGQAFPGQQQEYLLKCPDADILKIECSKERGGESIVANFDMAILHHPLRDMQS